MSQRAIIWLIGIVASGLAMLGRFGGLYEDWNVRFLNLPKEMGNFPLWVELVCVGLFAFGTAIVGMQITEAKFRRGLLLAILLQPISAAAVGELAGCWISPFAWLVSIVSAWLGVVAYRLTNAGKRERQIREIFGKYLSRDSLAKLLRDPFAFSAKTAQATILSARYLGNDWSEIEKQANRFRENSAWVELQTGNRLLAVWDMPLSLPAAAENAIEASLGMSDDWQAGVATGEVCGELLAEVQQWQMSGAVFEKADALCQANATFGSHILLDLPTSDTVRESIILRPVEFLILPASELGVEVFQPLALVKNASEEAVQQRDCFWEAVIFFRQKRFSEALAAFHKSGNDAVVQYYLRRLEKLTSSC